MVRCSVIFVMLGAACGLDTSKIDVLECSASADCRPDQDCLEGFCRARACEDADDCGDPGVYACLEGLCSARPCERNDECTAPAVCRDGFCQSAEGCADDDDCDDGLFCSGQERCIDRACRPGDAVDCSALDEGCTVGRCDEEERACVPATIEEGDACDDLDPCTADDRCAQDVCAGAAYDCDDGLDCTGDVCDGAGGCEVAALDGWCLIDETCRAAGALHPGNACEVCLPEQSQSAWSHGTDACDNLDPCTHDDTCGQGACAGTAYDCDDGLDCTAEACDGAGGCDNTIVGTGCAIDGACWANHNRDPNSDCRQCDAGRDPFAWSGTPGRCDDLDPCTDNDTCDDGVCVGEAYSCDDGLGCTDDACDGRGGCDNAVQPDLCLIDGACHDGGAADPASPCRTCEPALTQVAWSANDAPTPDDGVACTIDVCAAGVESHVADDALCPGQGVCAPCAGTNNGCAPLPTLTMDCAGGASPGGQVDCTVTLSRAGEAACVQCGSVVGLSALVNDPFDGCDLSDWSDSGSPECPIDAAVAPDPAVQEDALEADDDAWDIERTVDTRDFDEVRLCFDYADDGAGANDAVQVSVDTGAGFASVYRDSTGPVAGVDGNWITVCLDLDDLAPAAADNAALGIRISLTSSGAGDDVYLDNVTVDAWDSGLVTTGVVAIEDDFTGCDLASWTLAGDPIDCPVVGEPEDGREALEAENSSWSIRQRVDASALCDDVWVGLTIGSRSTASSDSFRLAYDSGSGYLEAWAGYRRLAADDQFGATQVSLSHVEPGVRFNPDLGVRFELSSNGSGRSLVLDDVTLTGAVCEDAAGTIALGAPIDEGGGAYRVTVGSGVQATTHVTCAWDGRPTASARHAIVFAN